MPAKPAPIAADAQSNVGRVRENNEDSVLLWSREHVALAVVADGMGGHKAGEVAAQLAIDAISGFWFFVSSASRQITSEAIADPPGLSTRKTTALIELSPRALRRYSTMVSEPTTPPPGES